MVNFENAQQNNTPWGENEELVRRLQAAGEDDAAGILGELWERNRGLIRQTVRRVTGLSEHDDGYEDMLQQAYFGFREAAYTFDLERKVKFSSYAVERIRWELIHYHERNGFTTYIPAFMRKRLRDCANLKQQMEVKTGHSVSYGDALKAMGFPPSTISATLLALRKLETASLDAPRGDSDSSLMDLLVSDDNLEDMVLGQVWHQELHEVLFSAIGELPEDEQSIIIRRFFGGVSFSRQALERGVTRQAVRLRVRDGYRRIRIGRYGAELAEFMPTVGKAERAKRIIRDTQAAMDRLGLPEAERGLLL